jgi:hypothetical protein
MNVWIITTGSSDVQLTTDKNWNLLCDRAKNQQESGKKLDFDKKIDLTKSVVKPKGIDRPITRFLAPARAMGIVYGNAIADRAEYYNDLDFPLLNNFSTLLQEKNIVFSRIIVFVTDQANLFTPSEKNQTYCPHWQDTCTLSSAVQFVSLATFGKQVKFLVSNEYDKERPADVIESPEYLRGIQVQQVKGLIKSGTPGAALQLLELEGIKADIDDKALTELEKLVDFFNLNRSLADGASEFDIEPATQRVIDALELIEKLFEQENYLQGIALLASAQETFLKCAIKNEIKSRSVSLFINGTIQVFKADDLIKWVDSGLKYRSNDELRVIFSTSDNKEINKLKLENFKRISFSGE